MTEYQQLGQAEDDTLFENEKHEEMQKPSIFPRRSSVQLLIVFHIILFGIYALSILYLLKRQPSDRDCDYKQSTYCQ
jgi:hypothetical protein